MALNTTTDSSGDNGARLISTIGDPQHAGFKVNREWPKLNTVNADTLMTGLNAVKMYPVGVKADSQVYSGRFINSATTPEVDAERAVTVRQLVTKVKVSVDSNDADMVQMEGDPTISGHKIRRAWHYIDPTKSDTIFIALNAKDTYGGITVDSQDYPGTHIVSRVLVSEAEDRTHTITQDAVKVTNVDSLTDLVNPLVDREKEILHPFGEGTGTSRGIIFRYHNLNPANDTWLMARSDAGLVARVVARSAADTGYTHVDRKTQTQDDRTMTFYILFEKKFRIDWSDTVRANPDHILSENKGTKREGQRRQWFGIDNTDSNAVMDDLTDTSKAPSGYIISGIRQTDRDDGSDDWEQVLLKKFSDTQTDSSYINPHGVEHVAHTIKHHDYDNLREFRAAPAIDAGYDFVQSQKEINSNGQKRMIFIQRKAKASNAVDGNGTPARSKITGYQWPVGDLDVDSISKQKTVEWDRVPIDSAWKVVQKMAANDTQHALTDLQYRDYGDGSARVVGQMRKVNLSATPYWQTIQKPVGSNPGMMARVWEDILDTKAEVIMDTTIGLAQKPFLYNSESFASLRAKKQHVGGRLWTVTQVGTRSRGFMTVRNTGTFEDTAYEVHWERFGDSERLVRTGYKEGPSVTDVDSFAAASHIAQKYGYRRGRYQSTMDGRYRGWKVKFSDTWNR